MSDDQTDVPDKISQEIEAAEQRLQELVSVVSVASIDVLGSSTRAYLDKAMLVAAIGIVVGLLGNPSNEISLGAVKITLRGPSVIPMLAAAAVLFYGTALAFLAQGDVRRWNALYSTKITALKSLVGALQGIAVRDMEEFQRYAEDCHRRAGAGEFLHAGMTEDGVPKELAERVGKYDKRAKDIGTLIAQLNRPAIQLREHVRRQVALFVALPMALSGVAFLLCLWTALQVFLEVPPPPARA
jgi:hypothetical protein